MLAFVIAIHREAEGIIAHYRLNKDMRPHPFAVYRSDAVILIVSGVGKLSAASATTYLLSLLDSSRDDIILINFGCCASSSKDFPIGYMSAAAKVSDRDTSRDYYSDLVPTLAAHISLSELVCVSTPFRGNENTSSPLSSDIMTLYDMESAGFCHVASKFLHTHQYLCIKVVTDYGISSNLDLEILDRALNNCLPKFITLIDQLIQCQYISEVSAETAYRPMIVEISEKLRLTHQMQRLLTFEVRKAAAIDQSPREVLTRHLEAATINPQERRAMLNAIIDELRREKPI